MKAKAQSAVFSIPIQHGGKTRPVRIGSGDGKFLLLDIACVPASQADIRMDYPLPFPYEKTVIEADETFFSLVRWKNACDPCFDHMQEPFRQQFHFTPKRGWMNDPNGLYHKDGVWHLFFQHNPLNTCWGNMHWSHAESADLLHWRETGIVLYPDEHGAMFSGSAFIDTRNSSSLGKDTILLYYTNCHYSKEGTQNLAYSTDGGKTFQKYEHNPIIPNITGGCDRDPVVVYDPENDLYRMVLYLGDEKDTFLLFASTDLLHWERTDTYTIPGGRECPGLIRMQDEATGRWHWVFTEANMLYRTGSISPAGKVEFTSGPRRFFYGNAYAGQVFHPQDPENILYIAWLRDAKIRSGTYCGSMTSPVQLRLVEGELRVFPKLPSAPAENVTLSGKVDLSHAGQKAVLDLEQKKFFLEDQTFPLPEGLPPDLEGVLIRDAISMEFFEKEGRVALALRTR